MSKCRDVSLQSVVSRSVAMSVIALAACGQPHERSSTAPEVSAERLSTALTEAELSEARRIGGNVERLSAQDLHLMQTAIPHEAQNLTSKLESSLLALEQAKIVLKGRASNTIQLPAQAGKVLGCHAYELGFRIDSPNERISVMDCKTKDERTLVTLYSREWTSEGAGQDQYYRADIVLRQAGETIWHTTHHQWESSDRSYVEVLTKTTEGDRYAWAMREDSSHLVPGGSKSGAFDAAGQRNVNRCGVALAGTVGIAIVGGVLCAAVTGGAGVGACVGAAIVFLPVAAGTSTQCASQYSSCAAAAPVTGGTALLTPLWFILRRRRPIRGANADTRAN